MYSENRSWVHIRLHSILQPCKCTCICTCTCRYNTVSWSTWLHYMYKLSTNHLHVFFTSDTTRSTLDRQSDSTSLYRRTCIPAHPSTIPSCLCQAYQEQGSRSGSNSPSSRSHPAPPPKQPLLLDVAQNLPLTSIIHDVCVQWNVEHPENYTFKYTELPPASSAASASGRFGYITEENRNQLKNGDILRLALTPPIAAEGVYTKVKTKSGDEKSKAVNDLLKLSKDYAFALEFIKLDGITCLTGLVEASQLVNELEIMQLGNILGAFTELMEHGIVSWDSLTENFVKKLINFIDKSLTNNDYFRPSVVSKSLSILESIVLNSSKCYQMVGS